MNFINEQIEKLKNLQLAFFNLKKQQNNLKTLFSKVYLKLSDESCKIQLSDQLSIITINCLRLKIFNLLCSIDKDESKSIMILQSLTEKEISILSQIDPKFANLEVFQ